MDFFRYFLFHASGQGALNFNIIFKTYMLKKNYYYLDDAAKFISSETGFSISADDLIDQAIQSKLFVHASASNWLVKQFYKEPFVFDGYCAFESSYLKSAVQTIKRGEKFYATYFSVTRLELMRHSVPYDEEFAALMSATATSCPLTLMDIVVRRDMLLEFIEFHCPLKVINNIAINDSAAQLPTPKLSSALEQSIRSELCNCFVLAGEYWQISFNQKTVMIKDTKGMQYINYLICNKGKGVHVSELYYAINPKDNQQADNALSSMTGEQLNAEGLSLSNLGDGFELLDKKALATLKLQIEQLGDQMEDAKEFGEFEKLEKLDAERDQIIARLSSDMGLAGKSRLSTSPIENIRKNIERRISKDSRKLQNSFPEFASHLKTAINTGTVCQYTPFPDVFWGDIEQI